MSYQCAVCGAPNKNRYARTCSAECRRQATLERFARFVVVNHDGCNGWSGPLSGHGYGLVHVSGTKHGHVSAHRLAWEVHHGPIPPGLCVLHKCDNRVCTRIDHLFLGTVHDNNEDKYAKGRQPRGERIWNAKLTDEIVRRVWALRAVGYANREISKELGFTGQQVSQIIGGHRWAHVKPENGVTAVPTMYRRPRKLHPEIVAKMKAEYLAGGVSTASLAEKYGVAPMTAWRYVNAKPRTKAELALHRHALIITGTADALVILRPR